MEDIEHPFDAYIFSAIGVILFLYRMLNLLYSKNIWDLMIFIIYALCQLFALAFGAVLINVYNGRGGM